MINLLLSNKKLSANGSSKFKKTENLCEFHAIYLAFLLFIFFQKSLKKIHDVNVLNFIKNFM